MQSTVMMSTELELICLVYAMLIKRTASDRSLARGLSHCVSTIGGHGSPRDRRSCSSRDLLTIIACMHSFSVAIRCVGL